VGNRAVPSLTLTTTRLELIAATVEISRAEIHDRAHFATLLGTPVPAAWPPPLNDDASMQWILDTLERDPDAVGWAAWYYVLRGGSVGAGGSGTSGSGAGIGDRGSRATGRAVIGNGGFTRRPSADGTVEIGYSILEEHQGKGYATEAAEALLAWAFGHAEVRRVIAHTFPELIASIRLLEKCGFRGTGPGSEEGSIRFELTREAHAERTAGSGPRRG
jgi:RimJ/RimL family protein N-acetyltransferase